MFKGSSRDSSCLMIMQGARAGPGPDPRPRPEEGSLPGHEAWAMNHEPEQLLAKDLVHKCTVSDVCPRHNSGTRSPGIFEEHQRRTWKFWAGTLENITIGRPCVGILRCLIKPLGSMNWLEIMTIYKFQGKYEVRQLLGFVWDTNWALFFTLVHFL